MEESEEKDCFIERGYQTILAEQVFESNKILFLPTGSGKTFIAIMVLKRLFHLLEPPFSEGGKRAVFLVNTVALVEQQAAVLVRHLAVSKVGQYSGDMQVDFWNKATWNEEFETFQVMVMTAEIFNNLLLKKYISLSDIAVLILDECHHAVEDHPMRQIMRLFEDCPKSQQPRVIGLTATLLNGTPKSVPKVRDKVKELEITLHSTVATVDSWDIVKQFSTKPRERYVTFPNYSGSGKTLFILQKIDELFQLCKQFKFVSESNLPNAVGLEEGFVPMFSGKKNEVPNLLLQVSKQLSWLGPFGCLRTIQAVFVTLRLMQQKMTNKSSHLMIHSLYCDLFSLSRCLLEIMDTGEPEVDKRKAYHFSSPKVKALINLLETHNNECNFQPESAREPLQALIFVEEKMTAKVLSSVLKNVAKENERYAFIKAAYIVGGSSNPFSETWEGAYSKHTNDKIITRFREKITNVLVSTDVLEEGIDIPACNLVVRFDTANGVRSYIQSKGRARHSTSLFALMVSNDKYSAYVEKIEHFCQIQAELENFLVGHTAERASPSDLELECLYETSVEPYYTPVGSKVTMTSAIQLVNGYCMFLAHDRFCKVFPSWRKKKRNPLVIVAIQLPRLSPLQELVKGRPMENLKLAKRAAALEMCRRLHQMGELNDYLLPNEKFLAAADLKVLLPLWEEEGSDSKSKPGTAKRIRSHSVHIPDCYQDCAPAPGLVYLHHIEISPVYVKPIEHRKSVIYKTFSEKRNFAIISSKPFNNVCQFPVFSKFGEINVRVSAHKIGSISKEEYEAIAQFHWNLFTSIIPMAKNYLVYSKESYLLAPTKLDADGDFVLDWGSIHQEPCSSNNFLNTVVTPIHRGLSSAKEAYFITRICSELNGHSPFPNGSYFSYCDYYSKRHRFTISKPEQHLLEAQPISVISNDLIPRYKTSKEEDESLVHFPMESCKITCADGCLLLKASLLPSILHRLERFFVANDLREKIANGIGLKDKLLEKKCSVWVGLSGYRDSLQESKVSSPKPKPTVSFVKDSPPPKKTKLSCGKPWSHCEEPKDVEHDFENVTVEEIDNYGKFVRNKFSVRKSPHQISDDTRKIPRLLAGEGAIKLLRDSSDIPHSCHILEAMTAASADDFWNLERLETLGDSFLKFVVSFVLYSRFPDLPEGKLTQVKGQILGNRNLYYCAKDKKLASYLKVKKVVPTEGWIPPSFSIPGEIFEENLMALVRRLDLSQEEQYGGVVKQSSIEALKLKAIFQSLPLTATDHHLPIDLNHHDISDKTVADSVESLIGAYLQVCGPIVAVKFLEYMMVVPKGSKDLLLPTTPTKPAGQLGQPSHLANLSALQDLLGYKFNNINLLVEALTHASTPSASSTYERLEFVGDAVIDFLVTAHIYENCGKLSPGDLTDLRSALVNNITFACLSVRYGFYKFMIHSSPALMDTMDRFLRYQIGRQHIVDEEVLILLEESECRIAETVEVPKALGDVFEALIGAVFVDCGKKFALVWQIIYRLMKNEISTFQSKVPKQVVRRLYETVGQHNISFRNSESSPEMHLEQVHVVLTITLGSEEQSFNGFGSNKSQAKKSAAKLALRHVRAE